MFKFCRFFSKSINVMSNFAHNSENYLVFYWKTNHMFCHGNQCIAYLKCKHLLLMTSYIASVTWLWRNSDYGNSFLPFSNESAYVHILMHFDKCILKSLKHNSNITVIWRYTTSYINLVGVWTATRDYRSFIGSIKSLNCASVVNILSRQNRLKITSKIVFDDVIMMSLYLYAIHYNQIIERAAMINCRKFHQVRIKTKKVMEEGGGRNPPPPPGLGDVKIGLTLFSLGFLRLAQLGKGRGGAESARGQ